jgi:hypothetical protein
LDPGTTVHIVFIRQQKLVTENITFKQNGKKYLDSMMVLNNIEDCKHQLLMVKNAIEAIPDPNGSSANKITLHTKSIC